MPDIEWEASKNPDGGLPTLGLLIILIGLALFGFLA